MSDIDNKHTSEIVCPYCGSEESDSWERDDDGVIDCDQCGKQFYYTRIIDVTYSTEKIKAKGTP